MTMEERSSGIEDGAPVISTGASITSANGPSNLKTKACEITSDASYPLQRTNKRSFDVAFLVAPDEKLIKRQAEKLINLQFNNNRLMHDLVRHHERQSFSEDYNDESSRDYEHNDRIPQNMTIKHFESLEAASHKYKLRRAEEMHQAAAVPSYGAKRRLTPTSPEALVNPYAASLRRQKTPSPPPPTVFQPSLPARKIYTDDNSIDQSIDPTLRLSRGKGDSISCDSRSAFTKVNLSVQRSSLMGVSPSSSSVNYEDGGMSSPRSSISPDVVTYQNSLSPPIGSPSGGNSVSPFNSKYPSATTFPAKMPYPFLLTPADTQPSALLDNLKLTQQLAASSSSSSQPAPKVPSPKVPVAASFRPELPAAVYPNLPYNPLSAVFPPLADARPRFLATGILPSSFAALGLAAQNVCAKCNLSFRMTSDLVYHMRSHHKSEHAGEAARRRREEKLRCPVCDESFRERHHLTRHMTAHQDKESDAVADQVEIKRQSATAAATLLQSK